MPATFTPSAEPPRRQSVPPPRVASTPLPAPSLGEVALRYLAGSPIVAVGPISRRQYRFSGAEPVQRVARADVDSLLASGYFRREN